MIWLLPIWLLPVWLPLTWLLPWLLQRTTTLENKIKNRTITFEETRHCDDPSKKSACTIQLANKMDISATEFEQRAEDCGRSTAIKILVDGVYSGKLLAPHHFTEYICIIIKIENEKVTCKGIRPKGFDNIRRIRLVRWLMGAVQYIKGIGDAVDYAVGRDEEDIDDTGEGRALYSTV